MSLSEKHLDQFENRLKKMNAHIGKWARRQGITCFRIYDCDVPGFAFSIDRYEDHIYISEFMSEKTPEEERFDLLDKLTGVIQRLLSTERGRIHFRSRQRLRGGVSRIERKENESREPSFVEVREAGHTFLVDLDNYLDTGLFLDHRITRSMIQAQAAGKRVLNLFSYTGSFTVYAAAGGAVSTLSVDLSKTYCDWAIRNLEVNGLASPANIVLNADVMRYMKESAPEQFALIVLDPPTFSNSKKMLGSMDIGRDHPALIQDALRVCVPGGTIYFSCNLRNFKLRAGEISGATITDITKQTIPADFRDSKIHSCYRITKSA